MAVAGPVAMEEFLDQLVFLSNSVPKSGSTYLFNLQEALLLRLAGKPKQDLSYFTNRGVAMKAGFVYKPRDAEFLDAIASDDLAGGPYILKVHTVMNGELRRVFCNRDNVFSSLAIRDPAQIFFSARDNFRKTGEFPEFADPEHGCATIDGYFSKILTSVRNTETTKEIPILKYEEIVSAPMETAVKSLGTLLVERFSEELADLSIDAEHASRRATSRFNIGGLTRPEAGQNPEEYQMILRRLAQARRTFGYA